MADLDTGRLLAALEPVAEENLNRHLATAQEWMPHEYVPWSLGRDFKELGGEPWSVEQSQLSPIARTALEVNLLTEDNLPSYHREIERAFGRDSAWGAWVNRWTAEEGRHAFCIRDYLLVTRGVDPDELERARMDTMETGYDSGDKPLLNVCAYVSFQELATRVSHRNTGKFTDEPIAEKLLIRVAKDENLHMIFYRNIIQAALELTPNQTMRAITDEVVNFQMPGAIIPGFGRKAVQMAMAGIYDLRIHHDDIVQPLLRQWGIWELEGLDADGEAAREQLAAAVAALDAEATRFVEKREERAAKIAARKNASPAHRHPAAATCRDDDRRLPCSGEHRPRHRLHGLPAVSAARRSRHPGRAAARRRRRAHPLRGRRHRPRGRGGRPASVHPGHDVTAHPGGVHRRLRGRGRRRCRLGGLGAPVRGDVEHHRQRSPRRERGADPGDGHRLASARHGDGVRGPRGRAAGRRWGIGRGGRGCRSRHVRRSERHVLRRHPGVPAPRWTDRQGRGDARFRAGDQADSRAARRPDRAAGAGADVVARDRPPRGARRRD